MRHTRYWNKDNAKGGYWSKCRDQISDEEANDGRVLHKYTRPFPGQRWQYTTDKLFGNIESIWIDDNQYGVDLKIGLQNDQGIDVLGIPVWHKKSDNWLDDDCKGFAKKIPNLSVHSQITLSTYQRGLREWKDAQGNEYSKPIFCNTVQQGGDFIKSAFPYENKKYVGIPPLESTTFKGKTIYDSTAQNDFLIDTVNRFIQDNHAIFEERKANRSMTPAEQEKQEPKNIPVMATAADDDDDDLPW